MKPPYPAPTHCAKHPDWTVALGRGAVVPPTVTYLASEFGYAVVFGPAAVLLGFTLITLMLGSRKCSQPGFAGRRSWRV